MHKASPPPVLTETQIASLSLMEIRGIFQSQAQTIDQLKHRLDWFERQMFGTKSERLVVLDNAQQLPLAELAPASEPAAAVKIQSVAAHTRRSSKPHAVGEADGVPFFDEARGPIETIDVPNPQIEGLTAEQFETARRPVVGWRSAPAATWCSSMYAGSSSAATRR